MLGIAALLDRGGSGSATMLGVLLVIGGTTGVVYQAALVYRRYVRRRVRALELARRITIRQARRKRTQMQRMQESAERERAVAAELQRREKRLSDSKQKTDAELLESELNADREAELLERVLNFRSQSHIELANSALSIFANRGWQVSIPNSDAPFDLLLRHNGDDAQEEQAVGRCVPPGRIADLADLHALDEWRESESAAHGYLISVRGFDERVVRELRLRNMRITLVEAHLLALWADSKYERSEK